MKEALIIYYSKYMCILYVHIFVWSQHIFTWQLKLRCLWSLYHMVSFTCVEFDMKIIQCVYFLKKSLHGIHIAWLFTNLHTGFLASGAVHKFLTVYWYIVKSLMVMMMMNSKAVSFMMTTVVFWVMRFQSKLWRMTKYSEKLITWQSIDRLV